MSTRTRALVFLLLSLTSSIAAGCVGTSGDRRQTSWVIQDGLCGDGLFGNVCGLDTPIAVGAVARLQVSGPIDRVHVTGSDGAMITIGSNTSDGLQLQVGSAHAGTVDLMLSDDAGHEIDRVHMTFADATTLTCGEVGTSVVRDLAFDGLEPAPVVIDADPHGQVSTQLGCRATDAQGHPLLTVDAVRWVVQDGATGEIALSGGNLLDGGATHGATVQLLTTGAASATIRASLGTLTADVPVTAR